MDRRGGRVFQLLASDRKTVIGHYMCLGGTCFDFDAGVIDGQNVAMPLMFCDPEGFAQEHKKESEKLEGNKHQKFARLANRRVNTALKAISLIGNLGNRSTYDYEEKEINKIFKALTTELESARDKFRDEKKAAGSEGFSL